MKKIVTSLLLLGSFSVAIAEPLNPTPEPVDQDTMEKILWSFNDLKVQDFAANNPERIKKANKLIENAQKGAIVNNCVSFKWIYDNNLIDARVTSDLESKTL